ncbi:MAG: hypothetical protein VKN33_09220 [Candidatus Sericytochromatia bacterium]|nr:hypothetical protein [Candidatus Sericytochromatia bacterium]
MNKHAGGRPAKSGARRELKTFRLVPDAIDRLDTIAAERGASTSDVLNDLLLGVRRADHGDHSRGPRFSVLPGQHDVESSKVASLERFKVLTGRGRPGQTEDSARLAHELARLRDALGGVLGEVEHLMAEQIAGDAQPIRAGSKAADPYAHGFRDGMLEALETAYALLQAELLITEGF